MGKARWKISVPALSSYMNNDQKAPAAADQKAPAAADQWATKAAFPSGRVSRAGKLIIAPSGVPPLYQAPLLGKAL